MYADQIISVLQREAVVFPALAGLLAEEISNSMRFHLGDRDALERIAGSVDGGGHPPFSRHLPHVHMPHDKVFLSWTQRVPSIKDAPRGMLRCPAMCCQITRQGGELVFTFFAWTGTVNDFRWRVVPVCFMLVYPETAYGQWSGGVDDDQFRIAVIGDMPGEPGGPQSIEIIERTMDELQIPWLFGNLFRDNALDVIIRQSPPSAVSAVANVCHWLRLRGWSSDRRPMPPAPRSIFHAASGQKPARAARRPF